MEMMTGREEQAPQAEVKKASLWEDIVDVFVSPTELYRRHANDGWVKPWLVLSIVVVALYFVFLGPNHEVSLAGMREAMARAGRPVPEGAGQGMAGQIVGGLFQPIIIFIGMLLTGALLWIAGAVAQAGPRFKQSLMIVAWASFPVILQRVLAAVLVIMKTNSGEPLDATRDVSFGVLRFLDPASLPLPIVSALGAADVFVIWQVVLWLIALKAICSYSTAKATAVAVATWLLLLLPLMGMGFLGQLALGAS